MKATMLHTKRYLPRLRKRVFTFRYLLYYSLVLVIPLFVVLFIYVDISKITEKDTYNAQLSALVQSSEIVDKNLYDMQRLVMQLKSNLYINQFFRVQNPLVDPASVSEITKIQSELLSYTLTNNYFDDIYVYSQKSGFLISNTTSVIRLNYYYNKLYTIDGMSYSKWISDFLNKNYKNSFLYNVPVTINGSKGFYLIFADSMLTNNDNDVSNLFVFINNNKILNLFKSINQPDNGWIYISDDKGSIITQSKKINSIIIKNINKRIEKDSGYFIEKINGRNMFITYAKSEDKRLNYVSAVTLSSITDKVNDIKNLLGGLSVLTIIVGGLLVLALSYKSSKPINKIMNLLSNTYNNDDIKYDFTFINQEVEQIVNHNQIMKNELLAQIPARRISIFHKMLNGDMQDKDELHKSLDKLGIKCLSDFYAVLIISINDISMDVPLDVLSAYKIILNKLMGAYVPLLMGAYDIDFHQEVVIIQSNQNDYNDVLNEIENMAKEVYNEMMKTSNISISFSGSITDDIMRICVAYHEAKTALGYRETVNGNKVLWYIKEPERPDLFFTYPIEVESKLMESIVNGKVRECKALLSNIYKINFIQNKLSSTICIQLVNSIVSTLSRTSEKLPQLQDKISDNLQKFTRDISQSPDINLEFIKLKKYLVELCKEISEINDSQSTSFITNIMEHINKNYNNCQISLSSVADEFGITEIYLSRFFKEQTGENFSKYIEKLRMEKAQELLNQNLRISSIAERIGYNSPQVFRRVYKRYYGMSPSDYNKE